MTNTYPSSLFHCYQDPIMGALDAHTAMSTQALNSTTVQNGMKDILLNHAGLWEMLREQAAGQRPAA